MLKDLNHKKKYYTPIPELSFTSKSWKYVNIIDNGEPLISLKGLSEKIIIEPIYYLMNIPDAINDCLCRKSVADKLINIANSLPINYKLLVFDAWRPYNVQKYLFNEYGNQNKGYVSFPSIKKIAPSPHITGGSIDLTIVENENQINMGTPFDFFGIEANTRYYENTTLEYYEEEYLINRRLLYNSMIAEGFTNYSLEWWHFDYGNQLWGLSSSNKAFYGVINHK